MRWKEYDFIIDRRIPYYMEDAANLALARVQDAAAAFARHYGHLVSPAYIPENRRFDDEQQYQFGIHEPDGSCGAPGIGKQAAVSDQRIKRANARIIAERCEASMAVKETKR